MAKFSKIFSAPFGGAPAETVDIGLDTIPIRSDESIGRPKRNVQEPTDLDTQVPATEYNRLLDMVVEIANAIGSKEGAEAGTLVHAIKELQNSSGPGGGLPRVVGLATYELSDDSTEYEEKQSAGVLNLPSNLSLRDHGDYNTVTIPIPDRIMFFSQVVAAPSFDESFLATPTMVGVHDDPARQLLVVSIEKQEGLLVLPKSLRVVIWETPGEVPPPEKPPT